MLNGVEARRRGWLWQKAHTKLLTSVSGKSALVDGCIVLKDPRKAIASPDCLHKLPAVEEGALCDLVAIDLASNTRATTS